LIDGSGHLGQHQIGRLKTGLVIGECHPRHRAKEFIRFLKRIDGCVQTHLDIHLVLDNYGTHKRPR
jgi:hypothetical protein